MGLTQIVAFPEIKAENDVMKSIEQFVASIREFRFAVDRLSTDMQGEEVSPATRQALIAQAKALQADIDRLLEDLGEQEAAAPELVGQ
jgi:hypothetical protein